MEYGKKIIHLDLTHSSSSGRHWTLVRTAKLVTSFTANTCHLLHRFKVMCLDTWGEGMYPIKIFPSSYWEPLRLTVSKPLVVEESTSVNVTRDVLEVSCYFKVFNVKRRTLLFVSGTILIPYYGPTL